MAERFARVVDHAVANPRQSEHSNQHHSDNLGNCRDGLILNLCHRLQHADDQADQQTRDQHWAGDGCCHRDGFAAEVDGFLWIHGRKNYCLQAGKTNSNFTSGL